MRRFSFLGNFKFPLWVISLMLLFFSLSRLAIYISSPNEFSNLTRSEVLSAFGSGIKFDFAIISIFLIPLLALKNLFPTGLMKTILYNSIGVLVISLVSYLVAGYLFFQETKNHFGIEIFMTESDIGLVSQMAFVFLPFMVFPFISAVLYFFGSKLFLEIKSTSFPQRVLSSLIILIFGVFGIFGKVSLKLKKALNISDAYSISKNSYPTLVLNGPFNTFQLFRSTIKNSKIPKVNEDQFLSFAKSLKTDKEEILNESHPFTRRLKNPANGKTPNILFITLESWSSRYIDILQENDKQKKLGVTQEFGKIAKKGLLFTNFHANGGMSRFGITSILTAIPQIPEIPILGKGLETFPIFKIGTHFKDLGYESFFIQSSVRESMRFEKTSIALGFEKYFGKQDFKRIHKKESSDLGWDDEMFEFTLSHIDSLKTPFLGFTFTGTTHLPYKVPNKNFEKFPHSESKLTGFYNTLNFSDKALGQFFKKAQMKPWFSDTIFIITADHTLERKSLTKKHKIPLLIYGPKFIKPGINNKLGSQIDIIPSIVELTRLPLSFSSFGTSLFSNRPSSNLTFESPLVKCFDDRDCDKRKNFLIYSVYRRKL